MWKHSITSNGIKIKIHPYRNLIYGIHNITNVSVNFLLLGVRIHLKPNRFGKVRYILHFFLHKQIFEEVSWKRECIRRKMKSFVILFEFMSVAMGSTDRRLHIS